MDTHTNTTTSHPFGYWLRAVDRLLAREFEAAFAAEGVTRRDWRLLSLLDGDVNAPELTARLQRHGGKKLRTLVDRGWVAETDGAWTLTDEGRAAKARLAESVDAIRSKVAASVSDEDFATTLASLEAIARELGWDPDERMPRGFGRHGFGPGFGRGHGRPAFGPFGPFAPFAPRDGVGRGHSHGFDPHAGFGAGRGFGRGFGPHPHDGHGHDGCGRDGHGATDRAFERGFDAGFERGRAERGA